MLCSLLYFPLLFFQIHFTYIPVNNGLCTFHTCYYSSQKAVTKVKMQEKEKLGIAEGRGGRRGPENVW